MLDRDHERRKYIKIYDHDACGPGYGSTNHGGGAVRFVADTCPHPVLDVGCGRNQFAVSLRADGVDACGVDFACRDADVMAPAHQLPFADKAFGTITAFDTLEHLLPGEVDDVLHEFARVASSYVFSISTVPSANKVDGETLHPTVRPEEWWEDRIERVAGVERYRNYLTGRFK